MGLLDQAKAGIKAAKDSTKHAVDVFSGAEIQRVVENYSGVYGEILLGMHRELERQKSRIEDLERRQMLVLRGLIGLGFAVLTFGVTLWVLWTRA